MANRVSREELDQLIYNKYVKPTQRPEQKYVGVEFEYPIVNLRKEPVDFFFVQKVAEAFKDHFDFEVKGRDDDGRIISMESPVNGDNISFDCSYNTLEFAFGLEADLNVLHARFRDYYTFLQAMLAEDDHKMTGMGINPYHMYNHNVPIANGRYRMLLHHLESYHKYKGQILFHNVPNFGLFSAASQTHVDVSEDNVVRVINAFSDIEPLKALLFANSPWEDKLCSRDYFWRHSLHGLNPHNLDMFEKKLDSVEELVAYYRSMSLYCLERDGKYINFAPTTLDEYFCNDKMYGEYYDGVGYRTIEFTPELTDLAYLRSFKFEDLTFRGTVEFRSVCEQPVSEAFAAPAFHAGLKANLSALEDFLKREQKLYRQGYSVSELRQHLVKDKLPAFLDQLYASELLVDLLDIAREGLKMRELKEEHLLDPLYVRAKSLNSPGREWIHGLDEGKPVEYYIDKFAEI